MTELIKERSAQIQQKQKIETRTGVKHIAIFTLVASTALLAILASAVLYAQGQNKDNNNNKDKDLIILKTDNL